MSERARQIIESEKQYLRIRWRQNTIIVNKLRITPVSIMIGMKNVELAIILLAKWLALIWYFCLSKYLDRKRKKHIQLIESESILVFVKVRTGNFPGPQKVRAIFWRYITNCITKRVQVIFKCVFKGIFAYLVLRPRSTSRDFPWLLIVFM